MDTTAFSNLTEYLYQNGESLTSEPTRGNPVFIKHDFCRFVGTKSAELQMSTFMEMLFKFNGLSNCALMFEQNYHVKGAPYRLTHVNRTKVGLVRKHLGNEEKITMSPVTQKKEQSTSFEDDLIRVLDLKRPEKKARAIQNKLLIIDGNYDALFRILERPSAFTQLGIQRAKEYTVKKPFYQACNDGQHNKVLAELCLSFKSNSQGIQDLPSNARIHKTITSPRAGVSDNIINCVKSKVHYLPLVTNITDVNLGNCSYLDTCHKLRNCRYLHFYTLNPPEPFESGLPAKNDFAMNFTIGEPPKADCELPAQWINCDVRHLPFSILGKFAAIISDPAWDIHMSLPYGTCKDAELLSMSLAELQDEGILFLWVTGRSIEVGRKALTQWGYTISDEMIWVKLNQLRRTIVTGRTGHWLNHSKENLIVGVKGNPIWLNKKIDLDYMVSGTRETSRKPDELYEVVERLVGRSARKLELFGRDHNIRPGWFSMFLFFYLSTSASNHYFISSY